MSLTHHPTNPERSEGRRLAVSQRGVSSSDDGVNLRTKSQSLSSIWHSIRSASDDA
ncbi:MAG: hypothetical protein KGI27_01745 [Thaumarchaeota archaeon]|nr:hypothetical protein [Nitrososphaerota archaeon]